jgi:HK97 family phage prohead protease
MTTQLINKTIIEENWNGESYDWFTPISWKKFVKRIDSDFECKKHQPDNGWKSFWSFYWSWKSYCGEKIQKRLPDFCQVEPIVDLDIQQRMVEWRDKIIDTYKKYVSALINHEETKKYEDTMLYFGWASPKEPFELLDISQPIYKNYFENMTKKNRTPFCSHPMVIKENNGQIESFYFVAPAEINKAFVRVVENGVTKEYPTDHDVSGQKKYYISGGVSDTTLDRDEEKMSINCIKSMEQSAIGGEIPLRNAHNKEWDSDMGIMKNITVIENDKNTLSCEFELNDFSEDATAKKLWHSIQKGKKIGFSIGGIVKSRHTEWDKDLGKNITVYDEIELKEVSVTGHPSNTGTFIYAISKSMKELEKKPLRSATRGQLRSSQFAYVSSDGKTRKLPIHDANHVRNAMARFNQTDLPSGAKSGAWRKILSAARRFGIKVNPKLKKSENESCQELELVKFEGAAQYLQSIMQAIWQMRNDLKEHMDSDDKEQGEMNDTLDEIKDEIEDDEEEENETEDTVEPEDNNTKEYVEEDDYEEDVKTLLRIMVLLSKIEYPKDAKQPDNYYDIISNLPQESYIYTEDGQKIMPHHNMDYTVNRDWLLYQLKRLMDGEIYVDLEEYYQILLHLSYHIMEKQMKKSTDDSTLPSEQTIPDNTEPEKTPTEDNATQEQPKEVVDTTNDTTTNDVVEDNKENNTTEEKQPEGDSIEQPKADDIQSEPQNGESDKSHKEIAMLVEQNANLQKNLEEALKRLDAIENTPVYQKSVSKSDEQNISVKTINGYRLNEVLPSNVYMEAEKSFTEDEAVTLIKEKMPWNSYGYVQIIRNLYK